MPQPPQDKGSTRVARPPHRRKRLRYQFSRRFYFICTLYALTVTGLALRLAVAASVELRHLLRRLLANAPGVGIAAIATYVPSPVAAINSDAALAVVLLPACCGFLLMVGSRLQSPR